MHMVKSLLRMTFGVLAFIGAGALSYMYLSETLGPRGAAPTLVTPKIVASKPKAEVAKPSDKSVVTKKETSSSVIAPGPLRVTPVTQPVPSTSVLSVHNVIAYTNIARDENGKLAPLVENKTLDLVAEMKLQDMFTRQYFEHVSPSGDGPGELADRAGYAYVVVGENLALGNFGSDLELVTAWMNSPGHRANILNKNYMEIGVAVGKGMYEGRETWLAVQSFGMPRNACPVTNEPLREYILESNKKIAALRIDLDAKKAQIDAMSPNDATYNALVVEFNTLVKEYNALVEANRGYAATYNAGVQAFNACINAVGAQTPTTH